MTEERQLRITKAVILAYLNISNFFLMLDIMTAIEQEFSSQASVVYGEIPYPYLSTFPVQASVLGIQSFLIYLTLSFFKTRIINLPLFMSMSNITTRSRK